MPETATAKRGTEATLYKALNGAGTPSVTNLSSLRDEAKATYERLEIPNWRRSGFWTTSFRSLELDTLTAKSSGSTPTLVTEALGDEELAGVLIQDGNSIVKIDLAPELADQGVIFCSLEDAARDHQGLFQRYFMKRLTFDRDKFEAGTAAFWEGGAFLYVPENVKVEKPFQVVYSISESGTAQYAHTLAVGDVGSEFHLREYKLGSAFAGQALHAGAFELYLEANARCNLGHLTDWSGTETYDVTTGVVEVKRDAHCKWIPAYLGGHLTRAHLELVAAEKGADSRFRGVYFAENDEHLDLFTVDLHEPGDTTGDVHWKGAASGKSRASFEGLIQINPGAQNTHTYLQTHSVMLSRQAKVDAIPSVIVSADQVSASHGGTVGEVDEDLVFYMMSRGLPREEAVRIIIEGFFEPVVMQLEDERMEALVRDRLSNKLSAADEEVAEFVAAH